MGPQGEWSAEKGIFSICVLETSKDQQPKLETLSQCFMSLDTADEFLFQLPSKRGQMTLVHQGITDTLKRQKKSHFTNEGNRSLIPAFS